MTQVNILEVNSKKRLNQFARVAFSIYKNDAHWVPPLIADYKKYVSGINNMLLEVGPHIKIIAEKNKKTVGRLLAGIDTHLNNYRSVSNGYISQFECEEDYTVAKALLDYASNWFKKKGITKMRGPLSLPGGDDNRGFIVDNFNTDPYIMNMYNKPYYNDFFLSYGFIKYVDCYAYRIKPEQISVDRYARLVPKLMNRFHFHLDTIDLKKGLAHDAEDILTIINQSLPDEWEDFMPLTKKEIDFIVEQLVPFVDPDFVFIARTHDGTPIGFNITVPNYNEVLKKMKGHYFPTGIFKFFYYRKKIRKARGMVLFVTPEFRNKGVSAAIYLQSYLTAIKKGYTEIEGSTIWEYNQPMQHDIERLKLKKTTTYRIYDCILNNEN